jgi:Xaa-Pro aminopeptidase
LHQEVDTQTNLERLEIARNALISAKLDALVCRLPENVLMLSGYWPLCGDAVLVFPAEGDAVCIIPETQAEEASAEIWNAQICTYPHGRHDSPDQEREIEACLIDLAKKNKWSTIGYEGTYEAIAAPGNVAEPKVPSKKFEQLLKSAMDKATFIDAQELLDLLRKTKTAWEIEKIRLANEIANIGFEVFFNIVDAGRSAIEIAGAIEQAIMVKGTGYKKARRVRAFAQVAVGKKETSAGWRPFEVTTDRKLQKGELAILELAVVADGYWADRTRVRAAGSTSSELQRLNDIVKHAQDAAISAIKPGALASKIDEQAREIISKNGLGNEFVHITGHGVGFRYHEIYPILAPGSTHVLLPNTIVTVEPGVYSQDFGGMRIEDDIVVTNQGPEILALFARELS